MPPPRVTVVILGVPLWQLAWANCPSLSSTEGSFLDMGLPVLKLRKSWAKHDELVAYSILQSETNTKSAYLSPVTPGNQWKRNREQTSCFKLLSFGVVCFYLSVYLSTTYLPIYLSIIYLSI